MIFIRAYSPKFPLIFKKEKFRLTRILGNACLVEHFGSTAIPGTAGKGIVDIMVGFDSNKQLQKAVSLLQSKGYHLSEDIDKTGKDRVFLSTAGSSRESTIGDIHLHLTLKDSPTFKNALAFRESLKKNSKLREEYIKLKYQIFEKVGGKRSLYTKLKNNFIKKVLRDSY